jgi:hypothetical protein
MNVCYFVKILPPLPLALADAGVYHSVKKVGTVYQAVEESQPWTTYLGVPPVLHVTPGEKLYLYSSVFAPARVSTTIVHRWEWYDATAHSWSPQSRVFFSINGGRDGGYQVYSIKSKPKPGLGASISRRVTGANWAVFALPWLPKRLPSPWCRGY